MRYLDRRAFLAGLTAALLLALLVLIGSRGMRHFDAALAPYAFATLFATFGIVYHYAVWLQRPPTALYWRRGWQLFLAKPSRLPRNVGRLGGLLFDNFVRQRFIEQRSRLRWATHFFLIWGCVLAAAVTFPLVFGWIHFEAAANDPMAYRAFVFGFPAGTFPVRSLVGWATFHVLDLSAVMVLVGIGLAFRRRMRDEGAMAVQQFANDFVPLILLFAVSVTGLMLTVSSLWLDGFHYHFLAQTHAIAVIGTLLYLPFGKFFHIFQRPAQLGVAFYKEAAEAGRQAECARCGSEYASRMQVEDLKGVLGELGFDYGLGWSDGVMESCSDGDRPAGRSPSLHHSITPAEPHYQDVCPACRRKLLAVNQGRMIEGGYL